MKADNKTIQELADEFSAALGDAERAHKIQGNALRRMHRIAEKAGKMLSDETDGGVVVQATGEGK